MPINETIAHYSDWAFESAFAIYVLAFVLLIAQYATTRADVVAEREARDDRVGGRGAGARATDATVPGKLVEQPRKPWSERLGNMALSILVVGVALHVASIVLRGFATDRFPLGNMYEFVTMACRGDARRPGAAARADVPLDVGVRAGRRCMMLMFLAGTVLYADAAPVVPALRSYWLPIHVTIVSIGSGIFLVSGRREPAVPAAAAPARGRRARAGVWGSSRGGCPARRAWTGSPTRPRSSPSRSSAPASSSARSGPRRRGAGSGAGTPRRRLVHHLGDLRGVPARPRDLGLARHQGGVDQRRRVHRDAVQPVHHQHRRVGVALVRRTQLAILGR